MVDGREGVKKGRGREGWDGIGWEKGKEEGMEGGGIGWERGKEKGRKENEAGKVLGLETYLPIYVDNVCIHLSVYKSIHYLTHKTETRHRQSLK